MNLPNIISLCRLCLVPVIIWLILTNNMESAFWITLIAAISDAIDGIIAKAFDKVTILGGYLDPIADKSLLVCCFLALGYQGYFPIWFVILVVFRDLVIVGGALSFHLMTHSLEMKPIMLSKINTLTQLILIVFVLGSEGFGLEVSIYRQFMIYIVGVTTLLSGSTYILLWCRKAIEIEQNES